MRFREAIPMKHTVIAPVGDKIDALFVGIREFPTEKVILITPKNYDNDAKKVEKELKKFKIPVKSIEVDGSWESVFKTIAEIKPGLENILINVATGDRHTRCAATSAAFVNGLKAFAVEGPVVQMLPVLKFSYYKMIPDKKLSILNLINEDEACCKSFEELSTKLKMSLPLISYHINGNRKSEGLVQMGLVEVREKKGRSEITLTSLGRMLIDGHVDVSE